MARIDFVPDLHREGACGTWGAIALGDGGLCAAMRLPVAASDRVIIDRVLAATREVMRAGVAGIAPIADIAVGGDQVWVFVGLAPGPSIADLLYEVALAPADLALIALDAGRTLVRLHDSGLWHGAFGADTIVASRTGAIHLTEAGFGPALDGLDVRIATERANSNGSGSGPDGVGAGGSGVGVGVGAPDGGASGGACDGGDALAGGPVGAVAVEHATPPWIADGVHTDVGAWADTVRLFADHLRAARADAEADALAACARTATDDGIALALDQLEAVAEGFDGYPSRTGLETVMGEYAIDDSPEAATILRAIDALFDTEAPSPPRPPRRFRSPLNRANRGAAPNGASPADAGRGAGGRPRRVPAQATGEDRAMPAAAFIDDRVAASMAAGATIAPPRGPRKTSAIPPRVPRARPGQPNDSPPSGLWAPTAPPLVRPASSVPASAKNDDMVRIGRGVPAPSGPRPAPARLGRPAWWPRIAINIGIAAVIVVGAGGYLWWRLDRPMHIASVSVTVQKHFAAACQLDADVVGTVITSGGGGTFTYQWRRSDGTTTAVLTAKVTDPAKPTEIHLPWTFRGSGEETAEVALVILGPERRVASTSFEYICGG